MPTYEFVCENCSNNFTLTCSYDMLKYSYNSCPFCKSSNTKRVYNSTPVIFKGKGFYKTDNKKGNHE